MSDERSAAVLGKPGESAEQIYERQRKAWIVRNRRVFRTLDMVVALVIVTTLAIWLIWPWSGWYGGLVAGAFLSFDIAVRLNPPSWIANWQAGAYGEHRTARALTGLPSGWSVLHDLPGHGSTNIDHVVVGPYGVFLLDTKNIGSEVHVDGDWLTVIRPDGLPGYRTDRPARAAKKAAAQLSQQLTKASTGCWVHAVVVVWGEMPQRHVRGDYIDWVSGAELVAWLTTPRTPGKGRDADKIVRALTTVP